MLTMFVPQFNDLFRVHYTQHQTFCNRLSVRTWMIWYWHPNLHAKKNSPKKQIHNRMNEWRNEGMKEWRNEGTNEWTNERTNERTKERKNERTNERKNERMNEWMHSWTIKEINPRLFIGSTGNGFYRCCSWRYTVALVAERLWKTQVQGAHRFKNGRLFVFHVFCYSHLRVTLWKNCFRTPVRDIK